MDRIFQSNSSDSNTHFVQLDQFSCPVHTFVFQMAPQSSTKSEQEKVQIVTGSKLTEDTVQVDNCIYDTLALASIHPGGELFVKAFSGRDATEAFLSYHRKEFPHAKVAKHLVGQAVAAKPKDIDTDYLELCALVEKVLPRHKAFAPFSYYVKIAVLLTVTLSLEYYIHSTASYKWYLTGFLGWCFALVGLNIQHDANHGAISRYWLINRTLGLTQNWIGGSALDWIHQHVVQVILSPPLTRRVYVIKTLIPSITSLRMMSTRIPILLGITF
jgi:cytochrome b involved in lipid metabolism